MCLDTITKTGLNKEGFGWKIFTESCNNLYSECRKTKTIRPRNKWLKAKKAKITFGWGAEYISGFHIFLSRGGAVKWQGCDYRNIQRVKYRKGRILGIQDDSNVIIADEMLILPEKRKGK